MFKQYRKDRCTVTAPALPGMGGNWCATSVASCSWAVDAHRLRLCPDWRCHLRFLDSVSYRRWPVPLRPSFPLAQKCVHTLQVLPLQAFI